MATTHVPECPTDGCGSPYMEQIGKNRWYCPRCRREYTIKTENDWDGEPGDG